MCLYSIEYYAGVKSGDLLWNNVKKYIINKASCRTIIAGFTYVYLVYVQKNKNGL